MAGLFVLLTVRSNETMDIQTHPTLRPFRPTNHLINRLSDLGSLAAGTMGAGAALQQIVPLGLSVLGRTWATGLQPAPGPSAGS